MLSRRQYCFAAVLRIDEHHAVASRDRESAAVRMPPRCHALELNTGRHLPLHIPQDDASGGAGEAEHGER